VVDRPQKWRARALCAQADPEAWFPEKGGSVRQATAICRRCPVQAECLDYALAHVERFGVWGGLTWEQRRELLRGGRRAAA
jgi:WhiB family redox-sensing transcriptional regulator